MHNLRKAVPSEAAMMTELALRSKAHWGYDDSFMRSCRDELTQIPEQIADDANYYFVAERKGQIVGFYKLENLDRETIILEALFIEPNAIGNGLGRVLFEHAKAVATQMGGRFIEIQSDPYAEPFYQAMGAIVIGRSASGSIAGRFLPTMQITL